MEPPRRPGVRPCPKAEITASLGHAGSLREIAVYDDNVGRVVVECARLEAKRAEALCTLAGGP